MSGSGADGLRILGLPGHGPEDVVVDEHDVAWTGTEDGSIWRVTLDGEVQRVGTTGGRPLGLELLGDGRLLVCDATRGLLAVRTDTGACEALAVRGPGSGLMLCNNAAVGSGGEIWFSDSSGVHRLPSWRSDLVEGTRSGRLLCRRPDGTLEPWLDRLEFANGVALAPDGPAGPAVLVAESGARRIRRVLLEGERAGHDDVLLDDLAGYPDNISVGSDGLLWVALASPVSRTLESVRHRPRRMRRAARALVERVPALAPSPTASVHVQAFDLTGAAPRLVHDLRRPATRYRFVTGVREHRGRVWLSSLEGAALAVLEPPSPRRV